MSMPTIFVSHGAPTLILGESPARDFLASLGQALPRPKAIVAVSAHWDTDVPAVSLAHRPETIHDFYGFPEALYRLRYAAPGAPELAERVALSPSPCLRRAPARPGKCWSTAPTSRGWQWMGAIPVRRNTNCRVALSRC